MCLYLLGMRFCRVVIGILATVLYIAFPDIQYWNLIVYAEPCTSNPTIYMR